MNFKKIFFAFLAIVFMFTYSAAAETVSWIDTDKNEIKVDIPSNFTVLTSDDIDNDASFFEDLPINKNDAISRIKSGIVIDAFSNDKQREIKVTVQSDAFSKKIVNFTPLSDSEKQEVMDTLKTGLVGEGHTLLSQPTIIKQSKYSYIKYVARIGSSEIGYSYTSIMTIIGGNYYEITCYNNVNILDNEMIDANNEVLKSFKINIKGDSGEMSSNLFQTIVSYIIIIVAIFMALLIFYSFVKQIVKKKSSEEQVKLRKRE